MNSHQLANRYDAIVVGARCAGAATAMLLAQAGAKVLVVDRGAYGSDTLSTHALMRTGVALLSRWGVLPSIVGAGTPLIRRTSFVYGNERIDIDIKPGNGIDALYAPRRTILDRCLVDAAVDAGADVKFHTRLEDVLRDGSGRVTGIVALRPDGVRLAINGDIVIGADGVRSTLAQLVNAPVYITSKHRAAAVFGYFDGIADRGNIWYFRPGSSVGLIPTNDGAHCVFALLPPQDFRSQFENNPFEAFLAIIEPYDRYLANLIRSAPNARRLRRFPGINGYFRQAHGPGWALVGDAGYFKDPITAHGITDALRDSELLARAVLSTDRNALAEYQYIRDGLSRPLFEVTDAIASFEWELEDLKSHHAALNRAMKDELEYMVGTDEEQAMAA